MTPVWKAGLVLATLLPQLCAAQRPTKKVGYDFPPQMKEDLRKEYIKLCDKGQILYGIHCSRCHNLKDAKGKWVIPDFSQQQINGYEIRLGNRQHEDALTDEAMNVEELTLITTFLQFKKKSGVIPVFPDSDKKGK